MEHRSLDPESLDVESFSPAPDLDQQVLGAADESVITCTGCPTGACCC